MGQKILLAACLVIQIQREQNDGKRDRNSRPQRGRARFFFLAPQFEVVGKEFDSLA